VVTGQSSKGGGLREEYCGLEIEVWEWPERNGSGLRGGVASEKWRGEKGVTSLSVVKKG
jgi:RNase P/RNase MRP subunit p29